MDDSIVEGHLESPIVSIAEAIGSHEYRRVSVTGTVRKVSNAYHWSNLLQRSSVLLSEIMSFITEEMSVTICDFSRAD